MLLFALLYLYTILTVFLLYVLLMGQTSYHRNGMIGKLHYYITTLPKQLCLSCINLLCGATGIQSMKKCEKYMCQQKNPILQIVYLTLMGVNAFLFFMYIFPMMPNVMVPAHHKYVCYVCYVVFALLLVLSFVAMLLL